MRIVGLLGLLALGCRADKPAAPPDHASRLAGDAAARPDAPPPGEPAHVRLPRSPDTPPHRTVQPLGRTELVRLAAFEHADFEREDRGTTGEAAEVHYTTATRPTLGVTVTIEPCASATPRAPAGKPSRSPKRTRACAAMTLDAWKSRAEQLKQSLPAELRVRPDTQFEIGVRELSGAPAIYTYQLGAWFGTDEKDQPVGAYSDAYIVYYNDGVNQIRVNAAYLDDAVGGIDHLRAVAPQEDLERLAVAFASFFVHEWRE